MKAIGITFLVLILTVFFMGVYGQNEVRTDDNAVFYDALKWRCIGPFRGGRSAAVTGVPGQANLFYMGSTGGGVWRTKDGGQTWKNISDGYFGGSIGAIEVAQSDPNVIYVGGGEVTVRGNVSFGYGIWKSEDAGTSWEHIGLEESRHIPRIRVHPKNHNLVYAAVLGDLYKASVERGVYRSKDGGETWERILFANADAGAVDLILDPNNPRIIYASTWRVRRSPYSLDSGGEGSALWKSTDSGDTWTNISGASGLPGGIWGISGISVSPVNSDRLFAIIENENGGVFRSDDAGKSWKRVNSDRSLRQRAWYYSRIYADTEDADGVYVVNVQFHHSKDGGKSFETIGTPHGDHHDLWIAPEDNQRMIIADDGGAQVSFDAGENWSTYYNQPTAQFYRVTTDNHFPFRVYGAQQDNSTVRILHRTDGRTIGERDWEPTAGGESAHIAIDPRDNNIVYGGSYGGFLMRLNHSNEQAQIINVWPDNPMGYGAEGMRYRFQWNFPVFFSPHDANKLYATSNHVHVSYDQGRSWEVISPDLTRNDSTKLKPSGGPITKDNTGVEYYCTIFAACESPYEEAVIWTGSDDGLVYISRDGGESWDNVTPKGIPDWMMINSIEPDPFHPGGAYIAGTRYKLGDYQPYLYKTTDYGKSWKRIVTGIEAEHFTRVVRADPKREGLLYAGTESGMYISYNDGEQWYKFQLNLPVVPVTDLAIKEDHLVAATQGRSFWILDDLTILHQTKTQMDTSEIVLFPPKDSYRTGGSSHVSATAGQNHPGGVQVYYYIPDTTDVDVTISFLETEGDTIVTFSEDAGEKVLRLTDIRKGANVFHWNTQYPPAKDFEGRIFWSGNMDGPKALPGEYQVVLQVNERIKEAAFKIVPDPRMEASSEELKAQFDFITRINRKITEAHEAIIEMRDIKDQLAGLRERMKDDSTKAMIIDLASDIDSLITVLENKLYQTQNQSPQDPLNFPIKLTNKLAGVKAMSGYGNFAPTAQAYAVKEELTARINEVLAEYYAIRSGDIPELNEMVRQQTVDAIRVKKP